MLSFLNFLLRVPMNKLLLIGCLSFISLLAEEAATSTEGKTVEVVLVLDEEFSKYADEKSVEEVQKIIKIWYGENAILKKDTANNYIIIFKNQVEDYPGQKMFEVGLYRVKMDWNVISQIRQMIKPSISEVSRDCKNSRRRGNNTCTLLSFLSWQIGRAAYDDYTKKADEKYESELKDQTDPFSKRYLK